VEGSCEHGNAPSGSIKCWEEDKGFLNDKSHGTYNDHSALNG
jgi:hypothetical protein